MEIDIPDLNDVKFTETCWSCDGSGQEWHHPLKSSKPKTPCDICGGSGERLTPVGERLLAFLRLVKLNPDSNKMTPA